MMKRQTKGRKMMIIIISCILISIIAVVVGRILFLITATKGKPIADYSNDQAALIVIDVQEDIVRQYSNTKDLIHNINKSIKYAAVNNIDIIYIKQEYSNVVDLILFRGKCKANSKGASLNSQLLMKSNNIFKKLRADAFSQKKFDQYLNDNMINTLYIVGADATACVYKTSLGGVNRGYHVTILEDCVFSANKTVLNKMLLKYEKNEIGIKRINDFL